MLEKMSDFFKKRLDGYDDHMRNDIESAVEFYQYTASCLPSIRNCEILDLGCGTGLELEDYFLFNRSARVTAIDLSQGMLSALMKKFPDRTIDAICGSYFDLPFGECRFDAAVSVESLHHFSREEKIPLYVKLCRALKPGGYFILTDYFALSDDEEKLHRRNFLCLKESEGAEDGQFYHFDTPLTVEHETIALLRAGFSSVERLRHWGQRTP